MGSIFSCVRASFWIRPSAMSTRPSLDPAGQVAKNTLLNLGTVQLLNFPLWRVQGWSAPDATTHHPRKAVRAEPAPWSSPTSGRWRTMPTTTWRNTCTGLIDACLWQGCQKRPCRKWSHGKKQRQVSVSFTAELRERLGAQAQHSNAPC